MSSCSADATVRLWDLMEGRLLFTMAGHESTVRSVKFSPNGRFLVSGSQDRKIYVWKTGLFAGLDSKGGRVPVEQLYESPPAVIAAANSSAAGGMPRTYLYNAPPTRGGGAGKMEHVQSKVMSSIGGVKRATSSKTRGGTGDHFAPGGRRVPSSGASGGGSGSGGTATAQTAQVHRSLNSSVTLSSVEVNVPTNCADFANCEDTTSSRSPGKRGGARRPGTSPAAAGGAQGSARRVAFPRVIPKNPPVVGGASSTAAKRGNTSIAVDTSVSSIKQTPSSGVASAPSASDAPASASTAQAGSAARAGIGHQDVQVITQPNVADTLQQMSSQLEMMMRTIQTMNNRMALTEEAVARLEASGKVG